MLLEDLFQQHASRFKITIKKHSPLTLLFIALLIFAEIANAQTEQWPGFRGSGNSLTANPRLPTNFSDDSISWTATLPGKGQSSPVRWNDLVFTTSAEGPNKETLWVTCHALASGKKLWSHSLKNTEPEEITGYISCAAPTPVVDERHVFVLFENGELTAYAHDGTQVWDRKLAEEFGPFEGNHGQGSSPILSSQGLVILMDHGGSSYLASLDKEDGKTLWKTARNSSSAWSTPMINRKHDGNEEIICSSGGSINAYDAVTGESLWNYDMITGNNVPSATIHQSYLVAGSSRKNNTQLLRLGPDQPELGWRFKEATSSFGSPLIYQDRVYIVNKAGILFCYELKSGTFLYDKRLPASTWASPLGAGGKVWFFCQDGSIVVIESGDEFEVVSESKLTFGIKDRVYGYAIAPEQILIRLSSELISIK